MRPALEVADIFRRYGEAFRRNHGAHLGRIERRIMAAIEACRTPVLGGHIEQCGDCGLLRCAYNSCLMGRSGNGELAYQHQHFSVNCSVLCLHNSAVLCLRRVGH